ncbi:MAG: DUF3326 domain-containing protein [Candidatus Melainabacteria bacterium]
MRTPSSPLQPPFIAAMMIPTGVGARQGGFGGDATPALNLLASVCDGLITHPNVANAAVFQQLPANALYVEGYGLDQFFRKRWGLQPVRSNRVGVVLDAGMAPAMATLHHNVLNAVRTVYGVDILPPVTTGAPLRLTLETGTSGATTGTLQNPQVLLAACRQAEQQGATAIALAVHLSGLCEDDDAETAYQTSGGVDPIGGLEAILSHFVVSQLGIPCANAPVFSREQAEPAFDRLVDPRTAAEFIAPTFLPCVLQGLARAPRFVPLPPVADSAGVLTLQAVDALVTPYNALGGLPVLSCLEAGIPVIAVADNPTVLAMDPGAFNRWRTARQNGRLLIAASYYEAAGILSALKAGLPLPAAPHEHSCAGSFVPPPGVASLVPSPAL